MRERLAYILKDMPVNKTQQTFAAPFSFSSLEFHHQTLPSSSSFYPSLCLDITGNTTLLQFFHS